MDYQETAAPLSPNETEHLRQARLSKIILGGLIALGMLAVSALVAYAQAWPFSIFLGLVAAVVIIGYYLQTRDLQQDLLKGEKLLISGTITDCYEEVEKSKKGGERSTNYYLQIGDQAPRQVPQYQYNLAQKGQRATLEIAPHSGEVFRLLPEQMAEEVPDTEVESEAPPTATAPSASEALPLSAAEQQYLRKLLKQKTIGGIVGRFLLFLLVAGFLLVFVGAGLVRWEGLPPQVFLLLGGIAVLLTLLVPLTLAIRLTHRSTRSLKEDLASSQKLQQVFVLHQKETRPNLPPHFRSELLRGSSSFYRFRFREENASISVPPALFEQAQAGQRYRMSYLPKSRQVLRLEPLAEP